MAYCLLVSRTLDECYLTIIPEGICLNWTQLFVLFTLCPPGPPPLIIFHSQSSINISIFFLQNRLMILNIYLFIYRLIQYYTIHYNTIINRLMVQIDKSTYDWLLKLNLIPASASPNQDRISLGEDIQKLFHSGIKVSEIVSQIFKRKGEKVPESLNSLKHNPQSAGQLYNWNLLNEVLKTLGVEIDSEMKTTIISGEWEALEVVINQLKNVYDSVGQEEKSPVHQSLKQTPSKKGAKKPDRHNENIDILDYVIQTLSTKLKLTKKQAIALIADNNRYLAHVFVKGVKGLYHEVEEILEIFSRDIEMIVSKIVESHDVCDFFLQLIKPSILSKSEDVVTWGCQIFVQTAEELMKNDLLPLGYQWLIKQNGGLSTSILALARHPKLSENIVNFILQFGKFNISELLTVELKKFCQDNLSYLKFVLQIFDPVVESKISSQELLNSGALDYWIEQAEKGADNDNRNSPEVRVVSVELLCRIWKAYPLHVEETLGLANNIMNYFKKGMRDSSEIIRLTLLEQLFQLLIHFARLKNPFASVIYKKLTFMFIQNHQLSSFRQMVLLNFQTVFSSFLSIPVDIFLEPFAKQLKISEGKTYILNISDMEFIKSAVQHKKLKASTAVELMDFLAKTYLNNLIFWKLSYESIQVLCERFIEDDVFLDYCIKLVKVCLALFLSSMKLRKTKDDQTRLAMQKRSQIVKLLLMFIELNNESLNQQIKILTAHTKLQIKEQYKYQHAGITQILNYFGNTDDIEKQILHQSRNVSELIPLQRSKVSNSESIKLPKINQRRNQEQQQQLSEVSKSRKSNISSESNKRHDFPKGKDYSEFETEQQRAFLQQNGLGFKVKKSKEKQLAANTNNYNRMQKQFNIRQAIKDSSVARERKPEVSSTVKVMQQIEKIKEKKIEEQMKKAKEQQLIAKKKEILKEKIKKEMEHRTVAVGKGNDKNVEARIFDQNQINERLLANHDMVLNLIEEEEDRDSQSISIVLKKYQWFLKKVFLRYENSSEMKKKEVFDSNGQLLHFISQIDCIRMLKQKGIEKDKTLVQQILKLIMKKEDIVKGINYDNFVKLLEQYAIKTFSTSHHQPLGDYLKDMFRKLAQGENFRMQEEEDETAKILTEKLRHDSELQIPAGYKKIVEIEYEMKRQITYMNAQILPQAYIYCYQIINEIIQNKLKIREMESGFLVKDEMKVVKTKLPPQAPKMLKRTEEESSNIEEAEDKVVNKITSQRDKSVVTRSAKVPSMMKRENKTVERRLNSVEKKKRQTEDEKRLKEQEEEKVRKARALELKKKLDKQNEQKKREKEKQNEEQKQRKRQEQQKAQKQKLAKEQYVMQQKQKVDKYKRDQEQNHADEKRKKQQENKKADNVRKQAMKETKKKKQEKFKQDQENNKKLKEQKQQEENQKKQQEEKKKQLIKKQAKKKIEEDKEKLQNDKGNKETLRKLYEEKSIQDILSNQYKEQLKALYNFGLEYNDVKVGHINEGIEYKGWLAMTQGLQMCDLNTTILIWKNLMKSHNSKTVTQPILHQNILYFSSKDLINQSKDNYQQLVAQSEMKLKAFIQGLKIPTQKAKHKEFFQSIKTSKKVNEKILSSKQHEQKPQKNTGKGKEQTILDVVIDGLEKIKQIEVANTKGKK